MKFTEIEITAKEIIELIKNTDYPECNEIDNETHEIIIPDILHILQKDVCNKELHIHIDIVYSSEIIIERKGSYTNQEEKEEKIHIHDIDVVCMYEDEEITIKEKDNVLNELKTYFEK